MTAAPEGAWISWRDRYTATDYYRNENPTIFPRDAFDGGYAAGLADAQAGNVSRETSPADAVDAMRIPFGSLVEARPRAGQQLAIVRGLFVQWLGEGAMDRDAIVKLDVDGIPHTMIARRYTFRLVR